ncbi:MAG: hypothetical protein JO290_14240 [Sphingomonadaceae bacterium]|nr:hypothetical protein [Sphingomonadaceae bacterium]
MSVFDRVYDALKSQVEMRADLNRTAERVTDITRRADQADNRLFDHEKRLIRIEALIDYTRGGARPKLPQG